MAKVRRFVADDIPEVANLHENVFGSDRKSSPQVLRSYLAELFVHNPWYDESLPSLVYEDHVGRIVGFLGVMPRRMSIGGRPIQVAISHTFMVQPERRSTLAGVELLKVFFAGRQDLSMAEGNDFSRKMWEGLGGTTELLYSICWMRLLRPSQYFVSFLAKQGVSRVTFALRPFCRIVDAMAARMPQSPFRQVPPRVSGENLEEETFLASLSVFAGGRWLRPEYDASSLSWLLGMVARKKKPGTCRKVIVRGAEKEILGWYIYYAIPGGAGEVVQIVARDTSANEVLDHLFYDAWRHGVVAVSGRLEPRFMQALSRKYCLFDWDGRWMLVHSRDSGLLQAIHRGDAFLTRLEGEWWIGFQESGWL